MSYYQVILKSGKTHPSLYKTIPNAIKNVGVDNIKKIVEVREDLVNTRYEEPTGTLNID
jgi:hypothetical protein